MAKAKKNFLADELYGMQRVFELLRVQANRGLSEAANELREAQAHHAAAEELKRAIDAAETHLNELHRKIEKLVQRRKRAR